MSNSFERAESAIESMIASQDMEDAEVAAEAAYYAAKPSKPIRVIYSGPSPRECFECGGYGFHEVYCDKVM